MPKHPQSNFTLPLEFPYSDQEEAPCFLLGLGKEIRCEQSEEAR